MAEMRAEAGEGGAEELRGNDGEDDVRVVDGGVVAGDDDLRRKREAGEKELVFAGIDDFLGELRTVGPERELVAAAAMEREGEGRSPGTGTQDDDAAHAGLFSPEFAPRRDSVPASRRRMFWWCLAMMRRATAI